MIGTCAAKQKIIALAADQNVVAAATIEDQVLGDAEAGAEIIGKIAAGQAFDRHQGVAFRIAAVSGKGSIRGDGDADAGIRLGIIDGVEVRPAVKPVSARPAGQLVITGVAIEEVVASAAGEVITVVAAMQSIASRSAD